MAAKFVTHNGDKIVNIDFKNKVFEGHISDESLLDTVSFGFSFLKKRVFHKSIDIFIDDVNTFLGKNPHLAETYLTIKGLLDQGEYGDNQEDRIRLAEAIRDYIIEDEPLIQSIYDYVEENYQITIESPSKDNQLQFKDSYAKRIIGSAILFRTVIPLLCHFMAVHNIRKEDTLFLEVVHHILQKFNFDDDGEPLDLVIKIQKFVETAVANTLYSDKVMWSYLKNLSINDKTMAIEIHRNVLTSILPKLDVNKSIVSFFHVVIKKQIEYNFTANFRLTYKPLSITKTDSDASNPFVKVEQKLLKTSSELQIVLMREDIANFIDRNMKYVDPALFDYYKKHIDIHTGQTKILNFFISNQIGKGIDSYMMNKEDYVKVVLIAKEWFERNNYPFISYILLGKPVPKHTIKHNFTRGKNFLEIKESSVFKNIADKYKHLDTKADITVITQFIGEVINTDFAEYNLPNGEPYQPTKEISIKSAMVEILNYVEQL
jgi:hypothetical protein